MSDRRKLLEGFSPEKLQEILGDFNTEDLLLLRWKMQWKAKARRKQIPPDSAWKIFGVRSGRGFGKTMSGANWIGPLAASDPRSYNFVVAPTHDDVRYTCFEGPTGLFSAIPPALIHDYNLTLPSITLTNGSIIRGFAAVAPERLRGPQCHRIWADEIASWRDPQKCWDNLMFGLRLGDLPQIFWTGTPKPTAFMRKLCALTDILILGSTYENAENLPDSFYENVAKYEGTIIGRQEIYGELIDPEEAGFVKRSDWRLWPAKKLLPKFQFILLSLDTAFTEKTFDKKEQKTDPSAATAWGVFEYERQLHVMLLDAWEEHLGFPALVRKVKIEKELTYGDSDEPVLRPFVKGPNKPRHQGRKPDVIVIEDKGSGISLRQSLALENIFTEAYNPGHMDKLSRLHVVSPLFPHKRVWVPESRHSPGFPASWAEPVITQVCTFVGEGSLEHDDLLDTATQALKLVMDKYRMTFTTRQSAEEKTKEALDRLKQRKRENPYG